MNIQTAMRIGFLHPVHCEDYVCHAEIGEGYYFAAVLDGCSSGTECQFASALGGKILLKLAREFAMSPLLEQNPGPATIGKAMIREFRELFRDHARTLHLSRNEQLCTLIFAVIDIRRNKAWVMGAGDGIFVAGKEVVEIDQHNRPDYFALHYDMVFDLWLQTCCTTRMFEGVRSLSLSTDGLTSFCKRGTLEDPEGMDFIDFVLGLSEPGQDQDLDARIRILEREHDYVPADDVGIVKMEW